MPTDSNKPKKQDASLKHSKKSAVDVNSVIYPSQPRYTSSAELQSALSQQREHHSDVFHRATLRWNPDLHPGDFQLVCKLHAAENIPNVESEVFCQIEFGTHIYRSSPVTVAGSKVDWSNHPSFSFQVSPNMIHTPLMISLVTEPQIPGSPSRSSVLLEPHLLGYFTIDLHYLQPNVAKLAWFGLKQGHTLDHSKSASKKGTSSKQPTRLMLTIERHHNPVQNETQFFLARKQPGWLQFELDVPATKVQFGQMLVMYLTVRDLNDPHRTISNTSCLNGRILLVAKCLNRSSDPTPELAPNDSPDLSCFSPQDFCITNGKFLLRFIPNRPGVWAMRVFFNSNPVIPHAFKVRV